MIVSSVEPRCSLADLTLTREVIDELHALLEELEYEDAFRTHGIPVRKKILLHGPSGCGKTSIAHALAKALRAKVGLVSQSQVIGSHLGESARNVASAIQYSTQNRCVLLLDEFDSIGSEREADSHSASKSLNHVVNTLLTDLETKTPLGLIVACTNFYAAIDPALIRRFDLVLEIPSVSRDALRRIADGILRGRFGIHSDEVLSAAATPASVVARSYDLLRRKVVEIERKKLEETMPLFDDQAENARHIRKKLEAQGAGTA